MKPVSWIAGLLALASAANAADLRVLEAVKSGNVDSARALVQQHADINAPGADGLTPLHLAVQAADGRMTELLLSAGANANATDRYGITPLWLAATNGDASAIQALIKAGANPNASLPEGETVLMTAARTGKAGAIKELLAHGANPNAKESTLGETALMWAAAENHSEAVAALIEGGADVNTRSTLLNLAPFKWVTSGMVSTTLPRGNWTALMYAARQNALGAARALAEKGADLNLTDPDGTTALVFAIINAHFDLAAMLLDKGADPNIADDTGMAALYAAVDMHTLGPMISRPAPKLVDEVDAADLTKRLLAHGANPNARLKKPVLGRHHDGGDASLGEGATPLMRATKTNDTSVMKLLLDGSASPFLTLKDYTTPLMITAAGGARAGSYAAAFAVTEAGTIEAMKLLIDYGADVNAFNSNGQTALHRAAQRGADQVVRFLADQGAKLDMKDKQGRMPVDLAKEPTRNPGAAPGPGHDSTVALLRQLMTSTAPPKSTEPRP
jgi:ankyrin repeat protein